MWNFYITYIPKIKDNIKSTNFSSSLKKIPRIRFFLSDIDLIAWRRESPLESISNLGEWLMMTDEVSQSDAMPKAERIRRSCTKGEVK